MIDRSGVPLQQQSSSERGALPSPVRRPTGSAERECSRIAELWRSESRVSFNRAWIWGQKIRRVGYSPRSDGRGCSRFAQMGRETRPSLVDDGRSERWFPGSNPEIPRRLRFTSPFFVPQKRTSCIMMMMMPTAEPDRHRHIRPARLPCCCHPVQSPGGD